MEIAEFLRDLREKSIIVPAAWSLRLVKERFEPVEFLRDLREKSIMSSGYLVLRLTPVISAVVVVVAARAILRIQDLTVAS